MKIVCIKTRYSIEPIGFLSFAKNMDKSLSNKYGQKVVNSTKKSTTDAIKTASKRAIHKTAEATGDLIDNKIAYKITSVSKKPSSKNNNSNNNNNNDNNNNSDDNNINNEEADITAHQKRYISHEEKQQLINKLRLAPKKMSIFKNS